MVDESMLIDLLIDKYTEVVRMLVQSEEMVSRLLKDNESLRKRIVDSEIDKLDSS